MVSGNTMKCHKILSMIIVIIEKSSEKEIFLAFYNYYFCLNFPIHSVHISLANIKFRINSVIMFSFWTLRKFSI